MHDLLAAQFFILKEAGLEPRAGSRLLDFGCGGGEIVGECLDLGFQAYGCDIDIKEGPYGEKLISEGRLRAITLTPYRLPFDDNEFDLVISKLVLEHVQDYPGTLAELRRVTKPEGVGLHLFPSRYAAIESHVRVPLGGMLQSRLWLRLWARLGVRSESQRRLKWGARQTEEYNYGYLRGHTNYLPRRALRREFQKQFDSVTFREDLFLRQSRRGRFIYRASRILPFLVPLFSTLRFRVVLVRKKGGNERLSSPLTSPHSH